MLRAHHVIALCVLSLLSIGVVMVNSAGFEIAPRPAQRPAADGGAVPGSGTSTRVTPGEPGPAASVDAASPALAVESPVPLPVQPVPRVYSSRSILLSSHGVFMVLALGAMGLAAILPIRRVADRIARAAPDEPTLRDRPLRGLPILAIGATALLAILMLVYLQGLGKAVKGSERWLRVPMPGVGPVSLQPSEIAKWALLVLIAAYATTRAAVMHRFWLGLVPALIAVGGVSALTIKEDLGTGALIGAASALVLIAAGARVWHFAMLSPIALGGLYVAIASSPYRVKRITAFLDPYADPRETGYHMIQSIGAVTGGGLLGRGLGNGVQKFGYLPEDTNDFIFAIICEELGAPGAALVCSIFITLLWASWMVISRETNRMLKLLGLGVMATVGLQAIINIAVVTAVGPTKGIALPLISAGGTGWLLTAFSLGLVVSMGRTQTRGALESDAPDWGDARAIPGAPLAG